MKNSTRNRGRQSHNDQTVPSSPDREERRRVIHTQREKARHRRVMAELENLFQMVPLGKNVLKSKAVKFVRTIGYLRHLERSIQAECRMQMRPIPPRCDMLTNDDSQQRELGFTTSDWDQLQERLDSAVRSLDNDTAVVPNLELPLATDRLEDGSSKWELCGLSHEDWVPAGSSRDTSQLQVEGIETSFIDIVCDPSQLMPLQEAPEVFVVSADGDITYRLL